MACNRRRTTTAVGPRLDRYPQELRLSDPMLREILSWDIADAPHYTLAELMEPAEDLWDPEIIRRHPDGTH